MNPIFAAALEIQDFCRARNRLDVEGIVLRQGSKLDRTLVWRELKPLLELKEDIAAEPRLAKLFASD